MRCEDVPDALATGGPLRRRQALRHAAHCADCAAVRDSLRVIAEELAAVPPLTDAQRRLWDRAADPAVPLAAPRPRHLRPALAALAAAAALLVYLAARRGHVPDPAPSDPGPRAVAVLTPDLDGMQAALAPLAAELADLRRRADLLDVRRDADALWARYAPRPAGNDL